MNPRIAAQLVGLSLSAALGLAPLDTTFPPTAPVAQGKAPAFRGPSSISAVQTNDGRWRVTIALDGSAAGKATSVLLAGSFTGWRGQALSMKQQRDGRWTATTTLPGGRHLYKFVVNGTTWIPDPANTVAEDDGQGGRNSVLLLGPESWLDPSKAKAGDNAIEATGLAHDPASPNDRQRLGQGWMVRYRTLAGDVQAVELAWRAGPAGQPSHTDSMRRVAQQGPYDVWESVLPAGTAPIAYTFLVKDGSKTVRDPSVYSLDPAAAGGFRTPDWAKDAVWYQVMVDRFRNGDPASDRPNTLPWTQDWDKPAAHEGKDGQSFYRHFVFDRFFGGDLAGLRAKLPYLKELGVNALYLMPVFQASTPHKYNTTNYLHVDEHFGQSGDYAMAAEKEDLLNPRTWTFTPTDKQFIEFLAEAKKQGFRVVIDGVFNHVGTGHPAFQDVKAHGRTSRFADWFDIKTWEPFTYDAWWGFSELPVFKKNPEKGLASTTAREHIFAVTQRWMDPNGDGDPSDGVDGWRLDVPNEVPLPFWWEWRTLVKKINPNAYISGEIWDRAEAYLDGRAFDGVMNYEFAKPAVQWVANKKQKITASELDKRLAALRLAYPAEAHYAMMNLLDSHDTDRVASMIRNPDRKFNEKNRLQDNDPYDASKPTAEDYAKQKLLALLQMTYVGAPMIYYGDEVGMWGASDPNNRKPMLWQDLQPYQNAEDAVYTDLLAFYKGIIAMRRANSALRTGSFRTVLVDDAQDVWVFLRQDATQQVLVALNASSKPATVDLSSLGSGWKALHGGDAGGAPGSATVTVPPVSGRVWAK